MRVTRYGSLYGALGACPAAGSIEAVTSTRDLDN